MSAIDPHEAEYYKEVLEALGRRDKRTKILNMLNHARARTSDASLRKMLFGLEVEILHDIDPSATPVRLVKRCKELVGRIEACCNQALGRADE